MKTTVFFPKPSSPLLHHSDALWLRIKPWPVQQEPHHVEIRKGHVSITLPPSVAAHVRKVAGNRRLSTNQVVIELIEAGIEAGKREKERFLALAEELSTSKNVRRREEIKQELARFTFGE